MKKTLTALLLATSLSGFAKNGSDLAFPKGSITVTAGTAVPNYLGIITILGGSKSGPYQVGVQYMLTNRLAIGAQFSTSGATTSSKTNYDYFTNTSYDYKFKLGLRTFMANADYYWMHKKKVALYTGIAAGYAGVKVSTSFSDNQDHSNDVSFSALGSGISYQIKAIGLRANFVKGLGIYADLGYGLNGIVGLGLQYTIKGK